MPKTVYNEVEIEIEEVDGSITPIILKPAKIRTQKKFITHMEPLGEQENEVAMLDLILTGAALLLAPRYSKFQDVEYAEDVLDLETCYKVLEVCGGMVLNDPKLLERAQELTALASAVGTD